METALREASGKAALLIAGPTASGKSALAAAVASAAGGVVVNADSMQVYHGLRILTARPSAAEEAAVPHRLYGFVDPRIAFSAGDYVRAAVRELAALGHEGRLAVVVGGTGLYFRALTEGLVDMPDLSPDVVTRVGAMTPDALRNALAIEDPEAAAQLSPADAPRLQRALAVKLSTGRNLIEWQRAATAAVIAPERWAGVFIAPPLDALYARIDRRFDAMMAAGALDEAAAVRGLGLPANRGVMKAHGMPHLIRFLDGEISRAEAVELGQRDTRRYAKRQFTWARRFMAEWRWLSP